MGHVEQRAAPRHEVRFQLLFSEDGLPVSGWVRNLSRTGMLLETAQPMPPGTVIVISSLEELSGSRFELPARVVRLEPPTSDSPLVSMGITFENLDDDAIEALIQILRCHNLPGMQPRAQA